MSGNLGNDGELLLPVLVQVPSHSALRGPLSYSSPVALPPGTLVRVPMGRRDTLGIVWDPPTASRHEAIALDAARVRPLAAVLSGLPALDARWRRLVDFAAAYYQRSPGEVALAVLPPALRDLTPQQLERRLRRRDSQRAKAPSPVGAAAGAEPPLPVPSPEQQEVLDRLRAALPGASKAEPPWLLFGSTGSGKTEVYLRCVQDMLEADAEAQALVLVPEINLTPQLQARFEERFVPRHGARAVVMQHSGMTPAQRLAGWIAVLTGEARVVLGTRMAVFACAPRLRLIVVDEEHDPSYKQQEGARYSARDLAVWRGHAEGVRVLLGSATPSLESWHLSRPAEEGGRYQRLHMPSRIGGARARLPVVRRVDMNHQPRKAIFSPPLLDAIRARIAAGEQSLVFLNRRGYAPVLQCAACDWKSECPHCSAYRVFHKIDRSLRCHHCGFAAPVPRACPACGNQDIHAIGRGTERIEEHLAELLAETRRPDGTPVVITRIDADSTRGVGSLQSALARVHAGEVDVLVGTQMVAKGHDFRRITLVAAIQPDAALFASDFRAGERLFGLLMQAAGRAGRDAALERPAEMWIQSFEPRHPLYEALKQHDYVAFAAQQLVERAAAGLPPFSYQALVRAEAREQAAATAFLESARARAETELATLRGYAQLTLYPVVPMDVQRVANVERVQMLIESPSRRALQDFLQHWQELLHETRRGPEGKGLLRWAIDVDPLAI